MGGVRCEDASPLPPQQPREQRNRGRHQRDDRRSRADAVPSGEGRDYGDPAAAVAG